MSMLQSIFLKEKSFENYSDGAVLELLFSTAGVRGDTQSIIASMFDAFGSFKGVLEARPTQLMKIPGVTKKVATLVAMIAPLAKVWERANMDDPDRISNTREAEAYVKSLLMGERTERFYVVALNARCKVLGCTHFLQVLFQHLYAALRDSDIIVLCYLDITMSHLVTKNMSRCVQCGQYRSVCVP